MIEDDNDGWPSWPAEGMTTAQIHRWVKAEPAPIAGLREDADYRDFGTNPRFHKRRPEYKLGWSFPLDERARFLKRSFDFPDLGKRGWAIIFQSFPPPGEDCEIFLGWVPTEREAAADGWIAFMNAESQRLLREEAAEEARAASRERGA